MKKFEILCSSDFVTQINALKVYISYNLFGEALGLINFILAEQEIDQKHKKNLSKIQRILS